MSRNTEKVQFNLIEKYIEIRQKTIKSLEDEGIKICEIKYEKRVAYNISKVKNT